MTTAHKPTYHPAIGRVHAGGYRYDAQRVQHSSRDLAAHMTLKVRQDLKYRQTDQQQLKEALAESERKHKQGIKDERARQGILESHDDAASIKQESPAAPELPDDSDDVIGDGGGGGGDEEVDLSKYDDADDAPVAPSRHGASDDDSSDDDSDEDAELARELDLIRREREEAKIKAAQAEAAAAEAAAQAAIHSNPLLPGAAASSTSTPFSAATAAFADSLNSGAGGVAGVKRRWDDDVVFKNQAKGDLVQKPKKRFINDTIRSDFHRSFLNRYVQ